MNTYLGSSQGTSFYGPRMMAFLEEKKLSVGYQRSDRFEDFLLYGVRGSLRTPRMSTPH